MALEKLAVLTWHSSQLYTQSDQIHAVTNAQTTKQWNFKLNYVGKVTASKEKPRPRNQYMAKMQRGLTTRIIM